MRTLEVEFQGKKYFWNGSAWVDSRFLEPPARIRLRLMDRLVRRLRTVPDRKLDRQLVLGAAKACLADGRLDVAARLARRLLRASGRNVDAAILLATVMRRQRRPRQALQITAPFARRRNAELLTVRAAALCDVGDWDAAEKTIRRAIAIDKTDATEATLQVMARVLSARARSSAA